MEYIFGIPGEETLDLMDSLSRSSIKFIVTRHEHGAAFIADVYGRLSHKPGVCLSTLGPGATNLITGVAEEETGKAPLARKGKGHTNVPDDGELKTVLPFMEMASSFSTLILLSWQRASEQKGSK